jgi:regulator of protease activity HflC (stomatin/prohibitin superfamily)
MEITSLLSTLTLLFSALIIIKGIRIVKQSEAMIVERLGKYHKTLEAGINIIIPMVDKPRTVQWRYAAEDLKAGRYITFKLRERVDLRETVFDFPKQSVIT